MNETIHVLQQLEHYPTFSVQTLEQIIGKDPAYTKVYLNRLHKRHLIQQLQRNVYTLQNDPLIIASRIIWPSYISLWAALRYHNLTEQTTHTISVITTRSKQRKNYLFHDTNITFEKINPAYFFGFIKTKINGFEVFIAEPEKALLDAVLLKKISLSEIYSIIKENQKNLSIKKLIDYSEQTHNIALIKRFGWMLDSLGYTHLKKLQNLTYKTTVPLDYARPPQGRKDPRWGVIINIGVVP